MPVPRSTFSKFKRNCPASLTARSITSPIKPTQVLRIGVNPVDISAGKFRQRGIALIAFAHQHAAQSHNQVYGGAQLMADGREEAAFHPVGFFRKPATLLPPGDTSAPCLTPRRPAGRSRRIDQSTRCQTLQNRADRIGEPGGSKPGLRETPDRTFPAVGNSWVGKWSGGWSRSMIFQAVLQACGCWPSDPNSTIIA
jgi:hypothetical protein